MTDIEPFKTKREREREAKQQEMFETLLAIAQRVQRGEINGFAIAMVDAAGKPQADWHSNAGASGLGHSIGCLQHRFFQQYSRQ